MTQSLKHIPPVNEYEFTKEFYDFIQRPENRGFNADFARERGDAYDSHVSRMHSPHVTETPSWLYEAAVQLDKAARVNLSVGRKGAAMLAAVVARHEQTSDESVTVNNFDATYFDLRATLARYEDGLATEAEVEAAKARHAEATGRVSVRRASAGLREMQP